MTTLTRFAFACLLLILTILLYLWIMWIVLMGYSILIFCIAIAATFVSGAATLYLFMEKE